MQLKLLKNLIKKYAQIINDTVITESDTTAYKNHIIRINKNSQLILDYIEPLAKIEYASEKYGVNFANALRHAKNLKTFAIQLTGLMESNDAAQIRNIFTNVKDAFSEISEKYLKDEWVNKNNFLPMKETKDSIIFIENYIKRFEATTLD